MKLYEYSIEHTSRRKKPNPDKLNLDYIAKKKKQDAYYNLKPVQQKRNKKGQFKKL